MRRYVCKFSTHQEILKAYQRLNASQWLINMHSAFLQGRTMVVKVGTELSEAIKITGGAVQGWYLGSSTTMLSLNHWITKSWTYTSQSISMI